MKLYSVLKNSKIIKGLSSGKLTTLCLFILAVLVFHGTLYQSSHGLFAAKQRFFNAWFVLLFGFVPFPALRFTVTVFILNLVFSIVFNMKKNWKNSGIIIIHAGVLLLFSGGAVASIIQRESYCRISEGETTEYSVHYHKWELALTKNRKKEETSVEEKLAFEMLEPGKSFYSDLIGDSIRIEKRYQNSAPVNESSIDSDGKRFRLMPESNIPENNIPALKLLISGYSRPLWASALSEDTPVLTRGSDTLYITLRRKRLGFPFRMTLMDFSMVCYPGTNRPKDFISTARLRGPDTERDVRISMNKPLRYKDYTFYQSSYEQSGLKYVTVLSVVKSPVKMLPYISSIMIFIGLFVHLSVKIAVYFASNRGKR